MTKGMFKKRKKSTNKMKKRPKSAMGNMVAGKKKVYERQDLYKGTKRIVDPKGRQIRKSKVPVELQTRIDINLDEAWKTNRTCRPLLKKAQII